METKTLTSVKAIRRNCLKCQGGHPSLVRNCDSTDCDLFPFRLGRNPNRKGIGGFQTHRKNVSLDGSENSSVKNGGEVSTTNTIYPSPLKPFITEEMAEKMIRAATVIIDTTNSIKSAVA